MLFVAKENERAIHLFLTQQMGLRSALLHERLHLSVYHARRALDGLTDHEEPVSIEVAAEDLLHFFQAILHQPFDEPPSRKDLAIKVQRYSLVDRIVAQSESECDAGSGLRPGQEFDGVCHLLRLLDEHTVMVPDESPFWDIQGGS
jgi:hypothetical protein